MLTRLNGTLWKQSFKGLVDMWPRSLLWCLRNCLGFSRAHVLPETHHGTFHACVSLNTLEFYYF